MIPQEHDSHRQKIQITLYLVWMISSILFMVYEVLYLKLDPFDFNSPALMIFLCCIPPLSIYYLRRSQKPEDIQSSHPMSVNALYFFFALGLTLAIIVYAKALGFTNQIAGYEQRMYLFQYFVTTASLSLIVSRIVAKKYGFYIHERTIQLSRKAFYFNLHKQLEYILGIAILVMCYGAVYWIPISDMMPFSLYYDHIQPLFFFIIVFLIKYVFLAIYERIHYQEHQIDHPKVLFSKNVLLLILANAIFGILFSLFSQIQRFIYLSNNPQMSHYLDLINNLVVFSRLYYIDMYLLFILKTIILFKSLKASLIDDLKCVRLWFGLQFVSFVIRFVLLIYNLLFIRLIYDLGPGIISVLSELINWIHLVLVTYEVIILMIACVFLKHRQLSLYKVLRYWILFTVCFEIAWLFIYPRINFLFEIAFTVFEFIIQVILLIMLSKKRSFEPHQLMVEKTIES